MSNKNLIEQLQNRFNALKSLRETRRDGLRSVEDRWKDAIEYVMPMYVKFDDEELTDKRYDTTATECVHTLSDGMVGNACPPNSPWIKLKYVENELNDDESLVEWLQEVEERLIDAYQRSNFYDVLPQGIRACASFGTVTMFIEEDAGERKINCLTPDPVECYIATNRSGKADTVFRRFELTADQAEEFFGEEKLPLNIKQVLETSPDQPFTFIHAVYPRRKRDGNKADALNMPYASIYFEDGGTDIIRESGYRTFPAPTWRYETRGNDPYGYSPTDDALPDIKTVNNMMYSILLAAQKSNEPALDIPDDRRDIDTDPNGRNYYSDPGRPVMALPTGQNFPITLELINDVRERIKRTYKVDHFLSLVQQDKQMTAREVFERKAENVTAKGATIGKFQSEWVEQITTRILQIEFDAGRMPEPPEQLRSSASLPLRFEYVGPYAQAMKEISSAQGIINTLQTSSVILELWPNTLKKVKPEVLIDEIFKNGGMPQKAIVPDEEYQKILQAEAKQQAEMLKMQMQLEQAKAYGSTTKRPEPGSPAAGDQA